MSGRGFTIFDTGIGRCGIAWGSLGLLGVPLPWPRGGRLPRLRGVPAYLSDVALDMTGIRAFNQRVYEFTRKIPRGETRTYGDVAASLRLTGAVHSVGQAIARNPFW